MENTKYEDMHKLVKFVNTNSFTWKAGFNSRFEGHTLSEIKNEAPSQKPR